MLLILKACLNVFVVSKSKLKYHLILEVFSSSKSTRGVTFCLIQSPTWLHRPPTLTKIKKKNYQDCQTAEKYKRNIQQRRKWPVTQEQDNKRQVKAKEQRVGLQNAKGSSASTEKGYSWYWLLQKQYTQFWHLNP